MSRTFAPEQLEWAAKHWRKRGSEVAADRAELIARGRRLGLDPLADESWEAYAARVDSAATEPRTDAAPGPRAPRFG